MIEIPALLKKEIIKRITINSDGITINRNFFGEKNTFISRENIAAFRYGIKFVQGYVFTIGRYYIIEIKDNQNKVYTIKLKSFYGIKRNVYYKILNKIFVELWSNYFINILNDNIDLYNKKQTFQLVGVQFLNDGISWDEKNKLLWKEIALSNYKTYFMVHHIDNPKQHKSFDFSIDWNAFILQSLLKKIIEQHK